MLVLELIALGFVCFALASIVWSTLRLGISPMPTSRAVLATLLPMIPVELEGDVHELGAGWGTLAIAIAQRCPKARVIAHEASPLPFLFCKLRQLVTPRPNLTLRFGDFHEADLRGAKVVVAYLWTGGMQRLATKFDAELPPGATVISHTFAWRGRTANETRTATDLYRTHVYRYIINRDVP